MKRVFMLMAMLSMLVLGGCSNPETPAGHEGYVKESPRVWGTGGYRGPITGPGSFGVSLWNNKVENVDMRPQTYPEKFSIVTKNELQIEVEWQSVIGVKKGSIREVVEGYGGEKFYARFIEQPLRSMVIKEIQSLEAMDIKNKQEEIVKNVSEDIAKYLEKTPFTLISGVMGNIKYPEKVTAAVIEKLAESERLKTKETLIEAAKKDAQIAVEEAKGIAKSQEIINATLTDQYLQHEAIGAQLKMANSANHTTVYIPIGSNGIPLVKTVK